MKKTISIIIVLLLCFTLSSWAAPSVSLQLDGNQMPLEAPLKFIAGSPYIAAEDAALVLECSITKNEDFITVQKGGKYGKMLRFEYGESLAQAIGKDFDLDTNKTITLYHEAYRLDFPPLSMDGYDYLPLQLLCQYYSYRISWNQQKSEVIVEGTEYEKGTLFRIQKDGTHRQKMEEYTSPSVEKGYLYFLDDEALYRTDITNNESILIAKEVTKYDFLHDKLYLYDGSTLSYARPDGGQRRTIQTDVSDFVLRSNESILIVSDGKVYLYEDGKMTHIVLKEKASILDALEGRAYYIYENKLYSACYDGTDEQLILSQFDSIFKANDWFYYAIGNITYRCALDGSDNEVFYGLPVQYAGMRGGKLLLNLLSGSSGYFYCSNADGSQFTPILDSAVSTTFSEDDALYFAGIRKGLYKMVDGESPVLLTEDRVQTICGSDGDWIYYTVK